MSLAPNVDFEYFAKICEDFTGADFKALLYNAQLEAIHEFTAAVEEGSGGDVAVFGMKARKGYESKLKKTKLKLKVDNTVRICFFFFKFPNRLLDSLVVEYWLWVQ